MVLPAGAIQAKAYGGRDWYSSREFKREVAFAFKLKASPVATSAAFEDPICGTDWQNNVPNDTRGHWEDAVSDMFPDLAGAKDNSWDHAARQVAKWCGASVDTSSGGSRSDKGDGRSGSATILSASEYSVFADAVVKRMRRVCGKEETAESPRGLQYRYRGLYVLPADQVDGVCEEAKATAGSDGAPPPGATGPKPAPGSPDASDGQVGALRRDRPCCGRGQARSAAPTGRLPANRRVRRPCRGVGGPRGAAAGTRRVHDEGGRADRCRPGEPARAERPGQAAVLGPRARPAQVGTERHGHGHEAFVAPCGIGVSVPSRGTSFRSAPTRPRSGRRRSDPR